MFDKGWDLGAQIGYAASDPRASYLFKSSESKQDKRKQLEK